MLEKTRERESGFEVMTKAMKNGHAKNSEDYVGIVLQIALQTQK